jgi:hypothetical protein
MNQPAAAPVDAQAGDRLSARSWWIIACFCGLFLLLRGPVMYRQVPTQDEDYFAVPGFTILQQGIPRIPYLPSRNDEGAFYGADRALFALPPLYFYWQAAVYAVLGPSTGNARLAAALAGMAAVFVAFALGRQWFKDDGAALWGAVLYAFSRIVYFPSMVARPDMVCGLFGLVALWLMGRWREDDRRRWLVGAGVAVGLGLLTHPFAVVYALQVGIWALLAGRGAWPRIRNGLLASVPAAIVLALWAPLISVAPEVFVKQFGNNVLSQTGPGLLSRLVLPFAAFRVQIPIFLEHVTPIQGGLMVAASAYVALQALRTRDTGWLRAAALTWSGVYLLVASIGTHPTKGYWCYAGAPMWICCGAMLASVVRGWRIYGWPGKLVAAAVGLSAIAAMLPGSGLRTLVAHVRHWNDINYNAPRFTQALIESLPADKKLAVDPGFIFDFHRAGRDTVLALNYAFFFDVEDESYDYLIGGYSSLRDGVPEELEAKFLRSVGDRDDLFACYAEIYRAPKHRRPERR